MKAIICELCGGNELIKQDGYFVCQHCGTKYALEEARKLFSGEKIDVSGSSVKIDRSNENEKLLNLARRTKREANFQQAEKYYTQLALTDSDNWEAAFYSTYCMLISSAPNSSVQKSVDQMINALRSTIPLIKESEADESILYDIIYGISSDVCVAAELFYVQGVIELAELHKFDTPKNKSFYSERDIIFSFSQSLIGALMEELRRYFSDVEMIEEIICALKITTALEGRGKENLWVATNKGVDGNIKSRLGDDVKCVRIINTGAFRTMDSKDAVIHIYEGGIIVQGNQRRCYYYSEIEPVDSKRKLFSFVTRTDGMEYDFKVKKDDAEICSEYINNKIKQYN